jgi:hypothetical protein
MHASSPLLLPVRGAEHRSAGGVEVDVVRVGAGRVKRIVYPAGYRWSTHMQPIIGGDSCQHAHVGFLAQGQMHIQYADGCVVELSAPQAVAVDPGHDGWVVGDEPAVVIEFDFGGETAQRFGVPDAHRHA